MNEKKPVVFDIPQLKALGARLHDRADQITQVTLQGLADDLRLAARLAHALADIRTEVGDIAAKTLDSATAARLRTLLTQTLGE